MFNKDDILARLLAGESADAIAKEMTDALNAAQTAAKAKAQETEKLAWGHNAIQMLRDYLQKYHPTAELTKEILAEPITDETARDAYKMIDEAVAVSEKIGKLMPSIEAIFTPTPAPATLKRDGISTDAIAEFLKANSL